MRALSMSSSGTACIVYCRIMNTPKPVTRNGTMTACSFPVQPISAISMYSGMMPICTGTIMVASMTSSSAPRPRKRSLANANPASEANSSVETVTVVAAMAELTSPRVNRACSLPNSRDRLRPSSPPGTSGGGVEPTTSFVRVATTSIQ